MTRRLFVIAAIVGLFAHGARAQIHMSAGTVPFTDARGVAWTPNICTGWKPFPNIGAYSHPIYNTTAYTATANVPIVCTFAVPGNGALFRVMIHLIEAVRTFNAPQRRVFDIWINGGPALNNVDTFALAGAVEAPVDVATVEGAPNGSITVSFLQQTPPRSSAMFAGIEILPILRYLDIVDYETPIGDIDGVNVQFQLSKVPSPATSLQVFLNGLRLSQKDFSIADSTLTFNFKPMPTDSISVTYWYVPK